MRMDWHRTVCFQPRPFTRVMALSCERLDLFAGYWLLSVVGAVAAYIMGSVETGRSNLCDGVVHLLRNTDVARNGLT